MTAVSDGKYKGETAEGGTDFLLKVKNGKVTKIDTITYGVCNATYLGIFTAYPPSHGGKPIPVKANGSFKVTFQGDDSLSEEDDKRVITGDFKGKSVSGKIEITGLCEGTDTFKASR